MQANYWVVVNLSILLVAWNQICTFWFMTGNDKIVQNLFWIKSNISKINLWFDEVYSSKKIIISFPYERTAMSTTVLQQGPFFPDEVWLF
jgi:hypothetical protein